MVTGATVGGMPGYNGGRSDRVLSKRVRDQANVAEDGEGAASREKSDEYGDGARRT